MMDSKMEFLLHLLERHFKLYLSLKNRKRPNIFKLFLSLKSRANDTHRNRLLY